MFKTVLFPVDQSREAREAAEKVVNIVKTYASRLVILSVVEPPAEEADAPRARGDDFPRSSRQTAC